MKKGKVSVIALATLAALNLCAASASEDVGAVYETRCANCHGAKADGVPKLTEKPGVSPGEAAARGVASQKQANIHGPALMHLSEEKLLHKLMDLKNRGFDSESYHSVMQDNLKHIEEREGEISNEEMAEYIYNTFGGGAD